MEEGKFSLLLLIHQFRSDMATVKPNKKERKKIMVPK